MKCYLPEFRGQSDYVSNRWYMIIGIVVLISGGGFFFISNEEKE